MIIYLVLTWMLSSVEGYGNQGRICIYILLLACVWIFLLLYLLLFYKYQKPLTIIYYHVFLPIRAYSHLLLSNYNIFFFFFFFSCYYYYSYHFVVSLCEILEVEITLWNFLIQFRCFLFRCTCKTNIYQHSCYVLCLDIYIYYHL